MVPWQPIDAIQHTQSMGKRLEGVTREEAGQVLSLDVIHKVRNIILGLVTQRHLKLMINLRSTEVSLKDYGE